MFKNKNIEILRGFNSYNGYTRSVIDANWTLLKSNLFGYCREIYVRGDILRLLYFIQILTTQKIGT